LFLDHCSCDGQGKKEEEEENVRLIPQLFIISWLSTPQPILQSGKGELRRERKKKSLMPKQRYVPHTCRQGM